MRSVRAYWYIGEGALNLGDALNPLLFRRLAGVVLQWVGAPSARLFGIGSNMELVRPGYDGIIFGTGISRSNTRRADLGGARVLAVRGSLTAATCGIGEDVLQADPGLLAADLLEDRPEQDIDHGLVRHYADRRRLGGTLIDVLGGPDYVIRQVARCRRITASSLHALVVADALGIPSRWLPHRATSVVKFEDYASSYGERLLPLSWRLADQEQVADKRARLKAALLELAA